MLPTPVSYTIWPSVIPADQEVTMTVTAAERAYLIPDGKQFSAIIIPVASDENYYHPKNHKRLDLVGEGGILEFCFTFEGEGEYIIKLLDGEKEVECFTLYSLYADLYERRALKGDLHSHSCRSDGTRDPAAQAGHYREEGYDFVALTDHNRYYPDRKSVV